jgi:hypothetical protein
LITIKSYFIGPCTYIPEGSESAETVLAGRVCLECAWTFQELQKTHYLNVSHDEAADVAGLTTLLTTLAENFRIQAAASPTLDHLSDFVIGDNSA